MKKEQLETLHRFTKQQIAFCKDNFSLYQKKATAIMNKLGFTDSLELLAAGKLEQLEQQAAVLEDNKEYRDATAAMKKQGRALHSMIILQAFLNSDKARKGYRAYKLETLADRAIAMLKEYNAATGADAPSSEEAIVLASYAQEPPSAELAEIYKAYINNAIQFVFLPIAGETAAAGEGQEITKDTINNIPVEQVLFSTSKVHNALPQIQPGQEGEDITSHPIRVSRDSAKNEVYVDVTIYTDKNITGIEQLTEFDKLVLNAVYTLYAAGQNVFSVKQVYKVMTGTKNQASVTDRGMIGEIDKSLQKCILTYISINCKQQREQQNYKGLQADEYKDHLLPMAQLTNAVFNSSNGKQVIGNCYKLHTAPPIYAYSAALNQIQHFNSIVLQVPISNTKNALILKGKLLGRIALAYNKDYIANVNYDSLYSEAGIVLINKMQKTRLRDTIIKMFDYWKSIKLVKAYKEYSTNGKVTGLVFSVYPKDKHKEIK